MDVMRIGRVKSYNNVVIRLDDYMHEKAFYAKSTKPLLEFDKKLTRC